jgi:hypothetical protein
MLATAESTEGETSPAAATVGVIEAVGLLSATELFVSGWMREHPAPGAPALVMLADGGRQAQFWAAWTDRSDVGPGTGFCGILDCTHPIAPKEITGLQFGGGKVLSLYESRTVFDEAQSIGLLRSHPGLASEESAYILRRVAARFDGTDTIAGSHLPIRVGIDDCVVLPGNAVLVSGWVFDPEGLASSVNISVADTRSRIDLGWITRPRADVASALSSDPKFALYDAAGTKAGFTALVTGLSGTEGVHLTIETESGDLHCPLTPRLGDALTLLRGVIRGIDPDLPSSLDIIDRHVAPILAGLPAVEPVVLSQSRHGLDAGAPCAIVIGCSGDSDNVTGLLAILATDPAARKTPIVVAAGGNDLAATRGDILRAAKFYGLVVNLVEGNGVSDHIDALCLGAKASEAEVICLLSANLVPATPKWFSKLLSATQMADADILMPARFDGSQMGNQAAERERARLAPGIECCLMFRTAFLDAGVNGRAALHSASKSRNLLATLAGAGLTQAVLESIDMVRHAAADPSDILAERADRAAGRLRGKP